MLHIKSIPAFNDNYIWVIQNSDQRCVVVDPGTAEPVIHYLNKHQLTLDAVLITHHHHDHTGGISELLNQFPALKVIGPANDPIPQLTQTVYANDQIMLLGETFRVLNLKGHTLGHVGYVHDDILFCGDALFSAGCGRVFEGSMEDMFNSLNHITTLSEKTKIYCAHEYTASNIDFALIVEPENKVLQQYSEHVNQLRAEGKSTLPTTLSQEKQINPFLRTQEERIIRSISNRTTHTDPLSTFTALRQWKDEF